MESLFLEVPENDPSGSVISECKVTQRQFHSDLEFQEILSKGQLCSSINTHFRFLCDVGSYWHSIYQFGKENKTRKCRKYMEYRGQMPIHAKMVFSVSH